jgi:hypothetical protein
MRIAVAGGNICGLGPVKKGMNANRKIRTAPTKRSSDRAFVAKIVPTHFMLHMQHEMGSRARRGFGGRFSDNAASHSVCRRNPHSLFSSWMVKLGGASAREHTTANFLVNHL